MNFPLLTALNETYYESVRMGDSEAHVGVNIICAILQPFTPSELAVIEWIRGQDSMNLVELVYLPDGRDLCVFERTYMVESLEQAQVKSEAFAAARISRV